MSKVSVAVDRRLPDGTLGPVDPALRLSARLTPDGDCLVFNGTRSDQGYGSIRVDGKMVKAHRLAWQLANGPIPDGVVVMHSCDNPPCCNVGHLSLGSVADNNRDRESKGRSVAANLEKGREAVRAKAAAITECPHGHAYTGTNVRFRKTGERYCAECSRIRSANRRTPR